MRWLAWILYSLFITHAGKPVTPVFNGASVIEENDGYKLRFLFDPTAPNFSSFYSAKQNATEIRWTASTPEPINKVYNFTNESVPFKKIVVWADPKKSTGILQLFHRNSSQYSFFPRHQDELVLLIKAKSTPRTVASKVASTPIAVLQPVATAVKKITLNVKDAPVSKLLRTLASEANRSMVFGEEVAGNVTVNIKDQTYEDAVDTVLRPTKYRAEHTKDATVVRLAKEGKTFRIFKLHYADVSAILKTVQDMVKDGQVSSDPQSNTLFVNESVDNMPSVERMVAALDQPLKQVEVESAIVELDDTNDTDVGFNLAASLHHGSGEESVINEVATKGISPFDPTVAAPKGMFVGLTWKSVSGILGFLNSNSKVTILARPRVLALNEQEANIIIGSKIGYKTLTVSSTGTVEDVKFLTVGTQLKIKPHITPNNDIIMNIRPEISDGQLDPVTLVPTETTTSSETKILARDGQTIVIGGLLRDRTEKTETKVPILGDIPLIGFFFKGTSETINKSEIMILLSPKLITQNILNLHEKEGSFIIEKTYQRRVNSLPPPKRAQEP